MHRSGVHVYHNNTNTSIGSEIVTDRTQPAQQTANKCERHHMGLVDCVQSENKHQSDFQTSGFGRGETGEGGS